MKKNVIAALALAILSATTFASTAINIPSVYNSIILNDEIKVKLQNKGNDKLEIMYQKKAGSRDLSGATINQGSTITVTVEAGCEVFYKVKGSKGPLLLTITAAMNGTTQVVKK